VLDLPDGERNLIGLARVSTHAQDAQLQQDALALAGCGRVYVEKMSTRKAATERPGLTAALDYLRAVTRSSSGSWTGSAAPSRRCTSAPRS
jgi:Resolvase, N terminal domain